MREWLLLILEISASVLAISGIIIILIILYVALKRILPRYPKKTTQVKKQTEQVKKEKRRTENMSKDI